MKIDISTGPIEVELEESFDSVCKKLGQLKYSLFEDEPRKGIELSEEGVALNFTYDKMSTVFLYLSHDTIAAYQGNALYLPESFWENPSEDNFISTLSKFGFERWSRAYPNAVDMVKEDLRIRLTSRKNHRSILIDDGSMIRR